MLSSRISQYNATQISHEKNMFQIINRAWLLLAWECKRIELYTLEKVPSKPFEIHRRKLFVAYLQSNKGNINLALKSILWQGTSNFLRTRRKLEKVPIEGKQLRDFRPLTSENYFSIQIYSKLAGISKMFLKIGWNTQKIQRCH